MCAAAGGGAAAAQFALFTPSVCVCVCMSVYAMLSSCAYGKRRPKKNTTRMERKRSAERRSDGDRQATKTKHNTQRQQQIITQRRDDDGANGLVMGYSGQAYKLGTQNALPTSQHQSVRLHRCRRRCCCCCCLEKHKIANRHNWIIIPTNTEIVCFFSVIFLLLFARYNKKEAHINSD